MDTSAIAARGADIRSLVREVEVAAPPLEAWSAWTTKAGIESWWGPPDAEIDLRIGGPFELFFIMDAEPGGRGGEGNRFLAYVPGEVLAFTWNAPPDLALRDTQTWVVVTFASLQDGGHTHVRLVHTGFLTGPDWDAYVAYFEDAWTRVLARLADHWAS
jgi:uncharacterized protein YndB with AHSA1/START domain